MKLSNRKKHGKILYHLVYLQNFLKTKLDLNILQASLKS
jgi:hypothetical protein